MDTPRMPFSKLFPLLLLLLLLPLLTCQNNLVSIIEEDVLTASFIDHPIITGMQLTNNPTPTWSWDTVPGAEYYRLGFSEDQWIENSYTSLSYTPSRNLPEGTYKFYVQSGRESTIWSESAEFVTEIDLTPPSVPTVTGITPTNDTTPQWTWAPVSEAVLYRYGFSENSWIREDSAETFYTQKSVLSEGDHNLYVQSRDLAGNWSQSGSFTIHIDLTVINEPVLTGPSITNDTTPTWDWNDVIGAVKYRYGYTAGVWITETETESQFTEISPLSQGDHTLYVQACNDLGTWSETAALVMTIDTTPPDAPVITGPGESTSLTPTWDWNDVADADRYRYGYDDGVWISQSSTLSEFTPLSDLSEATHTLYVQAGDPAGNWSASSSLAITVAISPPETPSPSSGTSLLNLMPNLSWEALPYSSDYHIQINEAPDFTGASIADVSSNSNSSYQIAVQLIPGTTYYWRVKVKNQDGKWGAAWSEVWNFKVAGRWALTIGGNDNDSFNYVDVTSDGSLITAGYTYSYGANGDLWIVKTDEVGNIAWQKSIGGTDGAEYGFSITETSDKGFIIAGNAKLPTIANWFVHPWIVRLSSTGSVLWEKLFSGVYDEEIYSVQETGDGGYIAGGYTDSFSADSKDGWIFKINSNQAVVWENTYGGTATSGYDHIRSVIPTTDGGYIAVGNTGSFTSGSSYEAWIMKLKSDGTVDWAKAFGNSQDWDDIFYDVKQTSDGGYIAVGFSKISGGTYPDVDAFILKLSSGGTLQWIENIGGNYEESLLAVEETSAGDFVAVGFTDTFTAADDGTDDGWVIKLSSSGSLLWQKAFGGPGSTNDFFNGVDVTASGDIVVSGYTTSYGQGLNDGWILRIGSDGDCLTLDRDTTATVLSGAGNFTETETAVTVTSTSMTISNTSTATTEITTAAAVNIQIP